MMLRALLLACLAASPALARSVTDSAGRVADLPERIETVFAAGSPGSMLVYVVAPETLTGRPLALRAEERAYVAEPYRDLPGLGG